MSGNPHTQVFVPTLEIEVMWHPVAAFQCLASPPAKHEMWNVLKRPLFLALLGGCMVSLVTSRRLTLRLVADGAMDTCFILVGQIAAMSIVFLRHRTISFLQTIDLFFVGYGPWSVWILCFAAVWAFASPEQAFVWAGQRAILLSAAVVVLWSGYIDFCFFRCILRRTPVQAALDLLLQRAISWSFTILIFGGGPLWPEIIRIVGK